jgi:hypothetical protein
MLRAIMEIRARPSSLPAMPRRAIWGHQFSDVLERPFVHLLSSLAKPWREGRGYIGCLLGCERLIGDCRRPPLRYLIHRSDLKVTTTMENAPGDAGDFVGERNRQLEAIEPPGGSLNP